MADDYHPRYDPTTGSMKPGDGQSPDATENQGTATDIASGQSSDGAAPSVGDITSTYDPNRHILIDRSRAYQDLLRVAREDQSFDKTLKEYGGRSLKRDWEAQLIATQRERDAAHRELWKIQVNMMPPDQREHLLRTDPDFARAHAELLETEANPEPEEDYEATAYFDNESDRLYDEAIAAGVPQERLDQFDMALEWCAECQRAGRPERAPDGRGWGDHTWFDHDRQNGGTFFDERYASDAVAQQAKFQAFSSALQFEIRKAQQTAVAPVQGQAPAQQQPQQQAPVAAAPQYQPAPPASNGNGQAPVGAPNPNLAARAPDMGRGTAPAGQQGFLYTKEQYDQIPPLERIEISRKHGGKEAMINNGLLYIPGLSEELGYKP